MPGRPEAGTPTCAARAFASYRDTIEATTGYLKDPAHEWLARPGRRRGRGITAQSRFVGLIVMAANLHKIAAHRELVANGEGRPTVEGGKAAKEQHRELKTGHGHGQLSPAPGIVSSSVLSLQWGQLRR